MDRRKEIAQRIMEVVGRARRDNRQLAAKGVVESAIEGDLQTITLLAAVMYIQSVRARS